VFETIPPHKKTDGRLNYMNTAKKSIAGTILS